VADRRLNLVEALASAREGLGQTEDSRPWYRSVGPALVTGAADEDPSEIGTYSANGAQFGYFLLWLVPICDPLVTAVKETCGRFAADTVTG